MIFVTGYFGAPIRETAEALAGRENCELVDLDARIEAKDGRSIARICMMAGEHAYRNQEYEQVQALVGSDSRSGGSAGGDPESGGDRSAAQAAGESAGGKRSVAQPDGEAASGKRSVAQPDGEAASGRDHADAQAGPVVLCGDGILHDDQTRDLILDHQLVIAGDNMSADDLWEGARRQENTYHAFMRFGTEAEKRKAFDEHHRRQRKLFSSVTEGR